MLNPNEIVNGVIRTDVKTTFEEDINHVVKRVVSFKVGRKEFDDEGRPVMETTKDGSQRQREVWVTCETSNPEQIARIKELELARGDTIDGIGVYEEESFRNAEGQMRDKRKLTRFKVTDVKARYVRQTSAADLFDNDDVVHATSSLVSHVSGNSSFGELQDDEEL